jgi:cytochrome c-type biogenesis protein CcmH/NrfG
MLLTGESRSNRKETSHSATLFVSNSTQTDPGNMKKWICNKNISMKEQRVDTSKQAYLQTFRLIQKKILITLQKLCYEINETACSRNYW